MHDTNVKLCKESFLKGGSDPRFHPSLRDFTEYLYWVTPLALKQVLWLV